MISGLIEIKLLSLGEIDLSSKMQKPHGYGVFAWCTRKESNLDLGLRRPTFYPLNYECAAYFVHLTRVMVADKE